MPITKRIDDPQQGAVLAAGMPNSASLRSLDQYPPVVVLGVSSATAKASFILRVQRVGGASMLDVSCDTKSGEKPCAMSPHAPMSSTWST